VKALFVASKKKGKHGVAEQKKIAQSDFEQVILL
jgi:hypothetical protein